MPQTKLSVSSPNALRHHVYEDSMYGQTPDLQLPNGRDTATKVARALVRFGVDGRGPQPDKSTYDEMHARFPYLLALHQASAGSGLMVDVQLLRLDRSPVRAVYTQAPNRVALRVEDRPAGAATTRAFDLSWVVDADGIYVPQDPVLAAREDLAQLYDDMVSGVMDPASQSPLQVEYARLNPFDGPVSHFGTALVTQRPAP